MDRDLDLLTALLLDPCLTTGEAIREAAARRRTREVERPAPRGEKWRPERAGPRPHAECVDYVL
jgi:hypothetical protein